MIKHFTKTLFIVWTCLNCFGAQAQTCPANLGTTINIASLPYSGTGLTTCGAGNDITGSNATICGSSNYYGGEDLVFIFTPTTTGNQVISLTSSSAWIGVMLYNGCPFLGQGGSCVSNVQSSTGSKSMTVSVTAGTTYYLVVDTWPSPTCIPSFDLSIAPPPPPPANDNCATATAFPTIPTTGACVTLSNQNTANATNSNVTPTGACSSNSGTPDDDIWFSFIAPATTVILEGTFVSGVTDVYWQVFSGSCGSTMTSVLCTDTNAGGTITGLTVGATYYIRLYTWSSGVSTVQNVCLRTNAAPPSNDECATATPLTSNTTCVTTTGTSSGASQSIAPITCASFTSSSALDVWYSFTAVTSSHTVTVTGQSTFDAVVDVRSGACNGTNIACSDITSGGGTETVSLTGLTVGDT
ncbi:MAG TPA: hypothetical protein PKL15_15565, partial [Saprospiraceae bacterium]|nr:hypothetical protein [Saprospiraceae bacterium]